MPNVPIPLVGPTYTSRSLPVSAQKTQNLYLEVNKTADDNQAIASLQPFPGLKSWGTTGSGFNRGVGVYNGVLYAVTGTTLYSISSAGVPATIGTIPGVGRCVLQEDTARLIIATGSTKPYMYDGTTLTLGTDSDLVTSASVTYIKNRVVYDGNNADVIFADLGSPLSVNSLNVTSSDSKPDDTLAVYAFKDQLFAFGETSIAPYYNSGAGNPPYSLIQNAVQEIGLSAIHSIASNANAMYFLGSDLRPYRLSGLQSQNIGNPAIGQAIDSYPGPEDAYGMCFTFNNQNFYLLTFPGSASWLFSEDAGWTSLTYSTGTEPHIIYDYAYAYGKHLVSNRLDGSIYELDEATYTDNGTTILRQRDTAKISSKGFGFPGKMLTMDRLEIVVETGIGLGTGEDPQLMMQYSDDGGRTWSSERWKSLGVLGDFTLRVEWFDLGTFNERQFRFKVSDPVKTVFISANADVSVGV